MEKNRDSKTVSEYAERGCDAKDDEEDAARHRDHLLVYVLADYGAANDGQAGGHGMEARPGVAGHERTTQRDAPRHVRADAVHPRRELSEAPP